jgi:TRAP-type C4-dicarboxylate transport system permease small subunit
MVGVSISNNGNVPEMPKVPRIIGILAFIRKGMSRINTPLVIFAGGLFFLYMFNVVADITGRYVFLSPVQGTTEVGELVLPMATFLGLAYLQMRDAHIRVTLLPDHVPPNWRAGMDILALLVGCGLMALMSWQSFIFARDSIIIREIASLSSPVPVYIGKLAYFIGCAVFCIQFLVDLVCKIVGQWVAPIPDGRVKT